MNDNIIDITQAAKMLKMSRNSLKTLALTGKIPAIKLAAKWIFSRQQLIDYVETNAELNIKQTEPMTFDEAKKTPLKRRRRNPC